MRDTEGDSSSDAAAERPAVDVVVPFAGSGSELAEVAQRMSALRLRSGDTLVVVDNTPGGAGLNGTATSVMRASERQTPAYARNRGAAAGTGEWLVFLDADAVPTPDLLDRYFDPPPQPSAGLLGGGVIDEEVPPDGPVIARYIYLRGVMSQERTFAFGEWGYPKSANVACRRAAFEAVGGFREQIRAAEDADLAYRLRAAGWAVERREHASVVHLSRRSLRGLVRQQMLWGAGGAWLGREYPGALQLLGAPQLARWGLARTAKSLRGARRDRDAFIYALLRPVEALAWELGRLRSNERPGR